MTRRIAPALALLPLVLLGCDAPTEDGTPPSPPEATPAGGDSGAQAALRSYLEAVEKGDVETVLSHVVPERREDLRSMGEALLPMLSSPPPSTIAVTGTEAKGPDEVAITVDAAEEGMKPRGTITMRRVDGRWLVASLDWKYGEVR